MAWIYLAESADSQSPSKITSRPLPIVKMRFSRKPFYFKTWLKIGFRKRRSGTMFKRSRAKCYPQSTLFTAVSHAKTFQRQDAELAWRENEADFFSKSCVSPKKHAPRSFFSKTSPPFELEDYKESSTHLPIFGMIVGGRVFLPLKLEPRTYVKDGGYWPTPRASPNENRQTKPTPSQLAGKHGMNLSTAVLMWPTPRAADGTKGVRTPGGAAAEIARKRLNGVDLPTAVGGGTLNPTWVEWLMGYPAEWTALEGWAMQWSRSKRKRRSKDFY